MGPLAGLVLLPSPHLTLGPFEDWSACRSPSRARRRRAAGHRQRVRLYHIPNPKLLVDHAAGVAYGHPETLRALEAALQRSPA